VNPIDNNLKTQYILRLIDINKNYTSEYKEYLESLSEEKLEQIISYYYLYDIKESCIKIIKKFNK